MHEMRELRLKRNEIFGNRVTLITVYRDEVEQMRLCKRACYFYLLVKLMIGKNLLRIETKKIFEFCAKTHFLVKFQTYFIMKKGKDVKNNKKSFILFCAPKRPPCSMLIFHFTGV